MKGLATLFHNICIHFFALFFFLLKVREDTEIFAELHSEFSTLSFSVHTTFPMRAILICVIRLHVSPFPAIQIIRKEANNKTKETMFWFPSTLNCY